MALDLGNTKVQLVAAQEGFEDDELFVPEDVFSEAGAFVDIASNDIVTGPWPARRRGRSGHRHLAHRRRQPGRAGHRRRQRRDTAPVGEPAAAGQGPGSPRERQDHRGDRPGGRRAGAGRGAEGQAGDVVSGLHRHRRVPAARCQLRGCGRRSSTATWSPPAAWKTRRCSPSSSSGCSRPGKRCRQSTESTGMKASA